MEIGEYVALLLSEPLALLVGCVIAAAVFLIGTAGR